MPSSLLYLSRRLLVMVPLLCGIALLVFILMHLAPGDPIHIMLGGAVHVTDEVIQSIRERYGLDQPVLVQFWHWVVRLVRGDLGFSYISNQSVVDIIGARFGETLRLMLTAQVLAITLAIPMGVLAAVRHRSWADTITSGVSLFGYSMPGFWLGLVLIWVFSLTLGLVPSSGARTVGVDFATPWAVLVDQLRHMILPVTVLALNQSTFLFRLTRSSMLDVLKQDYVRTARAKGLNERVVIYRHGLRNAMLPLTTVVGLNLGYVLSGAVLVETVFAWPGIGRLTVAMALQRDYPTLMGIYMLLAVSMLVATLVTDVVYVLLDPRVKLR
ncbi:MAG TPA: ABC transporter permease [Bacillota bacterium]|nr:ABC transporter permease [Bacillota bacterium]